MGIVVKDEADRKREGMAEERRRIANSGRSDAGEELRAREMELSRTAIRNPDPKKSYRLANKDQKGRIGLLRGKGYKVVPTDDRAQLVTGEVVDGAQAHGDLILMETSAENYERNRSRRLRQSEEIAGQHLESVREKINTIARDAGLVGPHKEAAFDESRES